MCSCFCVSVCVLYTHRKTHAHVWPLLRLFEEMFSRTYSAWRKWGINLKLFPFFQLCLVFSQKILHIYFCIFTNASIMLLVSRVYLRKQRGQRMFASDEFLLRQLLFVNSTWTAPCTIHIFQEDVNQCQGQNTANLFSRNSNLQHAIHDVMNVCEFGFFSGEFCDCRSTL